MPTRKKKWIHHRKSPTLKYTLARAKRRKKNVFKERKKKEAARLLYITSQLITRRQGRLSSSFRPNLWKCSANLAIRLVCASYVFFSFFSADRFICFAVSAFTVYHIYWRDQQRLDILNIHRTDVKLDAAAVNSSGTTVDMCD